MSVKNILKKYARKNRNSLTKCEKLLWMRIRKDQLGFRALRQKVISKYIVDFHIAECKVIIEVDGESHNSKSREDKLRQDYLESLGYKVLRFFDYEIQEDIASVIDRIKMCCTESNPPLPLLLSKRREIKKN